MKKPTNSALIRFFALLAVSLGFATAAPYPPEGRETSWVQPDGQTLQLRVFGDEYYARTETTAGHTVVYHPADNTYYYAGLSADRSALVPLETLATEPAPAGLERHLDLPKERIREIATANLAKYDGDRQQRWKQRVQAAQKLRAGAQGAESKNPGIRSAPVSGNIRGLTILVQFPDDPQTAGADPVPFPTNRDKIVRYCNTIGYDENGNTGSVRDYFFDQSLGQLTYVQTVTQVVTVPRPRNFYNYSDYPTNRVLFTDIGATAMRLINDAVTVLKSQNFDFTGLTLGPGNQAVATNIFFAGNDSGVFARGLWPHQFTISPRISVGTTANPVFLANYQITNIPNAAPVIGTFCHENGHLVLDYPDLYSEFGEGVGQHCLMGSGNYLDGGRTPAPINAHFKDLSGWANVIDLAPTDFLTATLPTTGNVAYRITNPAAATEFFVVENRGAGDKWAASTDDKGIAIWHIDETVSGNYNILPGGNYGVSLEQADGDFDLEVGVNRGDSRDLYDLATPAFNGSTAPNSNWWDGSASGVKVEVLAISGSRTEVLFGEVPPNTILLDSPNGGQVIFPASNYPVRWRANISGNVRIDLFKAGVFHSLLSPNEPNDGRFVWAVASTLTPGSDYTIRISSLTNPVPAIDESESPFTVSNATFPAGGVIPYGWFKPAGSKTRWKVTKSSVYEGTHSLISGKVGDGRSSGIAYRSHFKPGFVSFYMRVSSEQSSDFGRFYIDGVRQYFTEFGGASGISGNSGWVYASFPVSAGVHTFQWTYEKDDSYAELQDRVWLDGVSLPETTQEIAVADPRGVDLADGQSTSLFSATPIGSPSGALRFRIRNLGQADLTGLTITTEGANPGDFSASPLKKVNLLPGQSVKFDVIFNPTAMGPRTAGLRIQSNDVDEGNFLINLAGDGLGVPKILVNHPTKKKLKDNGKKAVNFGFARVKTSGKTKTFTIRNKGSGSLGGLAVSMKGAGRKDFKIVQPAMTSLAPGETTTFKVTFTPSKKNKRSAKIKISSDDKKAGPFDISVVGTGAPNLRRSVLVAGSNLSAGGLVDAVLGKGAPSLVQSTSVEVVDGQKYLALTLAKDSATPVAGTVEVSSNLLDWSSGHQHTTTLVDDATILKVRDNTPITPDAKRYIRFK